MGSIRSTGLGSRKSLSIGSMTLHSDGDEDVSDSKDDSVADDKDTPLEKLKQEKVSGNLRAHFDAIRIMMLGLDEQLKRKEGELEQVIDSARKEGEKYHALRLELEESD